MASPRIRLPALLAALSFAAGGIAAPRDARVPGGIAVLALAPADAPRPRASLAGQPVLVERHGGRWLALVGLPLDLEPGPQRLDVAGGAPLAFTVVAKRYPEQHITLKDQGKVELSPENEARATREIDEIRRLKTHWREADDVDIDLALPASGRLSGHFGARRIFNGQPRAPHAGLDLALPRGTPVRAGAAATVLAVGDYFFNGRTLFLDHGNGLISMLCHLERIDVQVGDTVRRDQVVARSGMSGRASGPHLHWSVILNGALVDPELFLPLPTRKPPR